MATIKKNLSIFSKALFSLVEMYSMKKVVLLAVAEQDWQKICVEGLSGIIPAGWGN